MIRPMTMEHMALKRVPVHLRRVLPLLHRLGANWNQLPPAAIEDKLLHLSDPDSQLSLQEKRELGNYLRLHGYQPWWEGHES